MKKPNCTFIFLLIAAMFMSIQGCVYGVARDAATNTAVSGAQIYAYAKCSGAGCAAHASGSWVITKTGTDGSYIYDAYAYSVDPSEAMYVYPQPGQEALLLLYSKSGYQSRFVWHKPDYKKYSTGGNTYYYTIVPTVYLSPSGALDTDGDGVCDDAEARYGTDPNKADTDGDGLSDNAELFGFDGLDLYYYGADPRHKDIFLEIDYYPGLKPADTAIQMVVDSFADAPVANPDGISGIDLHALVDDQIAAADVDNDLNPAWTDFDVIKNKYFETRRNRAFHYTLFANQYDGGSSSGISRGIPAHDFIVSLGNWSTPGGTVQQQAGTLMHEFGHNLGLRHGGDENENYKPNYISIMSYNYQLVGLTVDGTAGVVDYSRLQISSVNEASVRETIAFGPVAGSTTTETDLAHYAVRVRTCGGSRVWLSGNASANLDFDRDGVIENFWQPEDLNGDCDSIDIFHNSIDDWSHLVFNGGGTIGDDALGDDSGEAIQLVSPEDMEPCATEDQA
jgi:hypothetical protein